MTSGRVRHRMSLLPFSCVVTSANRSPWYSGSARPRFWIITPHEPSKIRMRSAAAAFSAAMRSLRSVMAVSRSFLAQAQHPADGHGQLGAVGGEEVELRVALLLQPGAHLGGHGGGHQPARGRIVVE